MLLQGYVITWSYCPLGKYDTNIWISMLKIYDFYDANQCFHPYRAKEYKTVLCKEWYRV